MRATAVAVNVSLNLANKNAVACKTKWFADAVAAVKEATKDGDVTMQMLYEDILEDIGEEVGFQNTGFLSEDGYAQPNFVFENLHFVVEHAPRMGEICEVLQKGWSISRTSPGQKVPAELYEPQEESIHDKLRAVAQIPLSPQQIRIAEMVVSAGYKDPEYAGDAFKFTLWQLTDPHKKKELEKFSIACKMAPKKKKRDKLARKGKTSVATVLEGNEVGEVAEALTKRPGGEIPEPAL